MKKILNIIKKIIIGIFATIFFGFVIFMTVLLLNLNDYGVAQINNTSLLVIKEDISSEVYKKGDLVLVEGRKISNLKEGDEIFVYKVDKTGIVSIDLGTIGEVHIEDDAIEYQNGDTYAMEFVIGKANKVYSGLGNYLAIIQSKWGFLFIILVPSFLIFLYEFYALIIEIKYGKDEVVPAPTAQ